MNKRKWYTIITYSISVLILLFIILVRYFIFDYIILDNHTMEPNYSHDQILISSRIFKPERFDTVVIKEKDKKLVARIIGIPGDHIKFEYDTLYISDKKIDENYLINYLEYYNNDTIQQVYSKIGLKLPSDPRKILQRYIPNINWDIIYKEGQSYKQELGKQAIITPDNQQGY